MNKEVIEKVAQFQKVALSHIQELESKVASLEKQAASHTDLAEGLEMAAVKVAKALYDSDFITDNFARKDFIKKASKDPEYLAKALIKICEAQDVAAFGSPSSVTIKVASNGEVDPIYAKIFGYTNSLDFLDG